MKKFLFTTLSAVALLTTAATADANDRTGDTVYYTSSEMAVVKPVSLGQLIAYRMDNPNLSQFRDAIKDARLPANYDPDKGYTVFAVTNNASTSTGAKPVEYYVVNDRIALRNLCHTKSEASCTNTEWVKTISGDTLHITKFGSEYYVNDMLVNDVDRNPEGVIYTIGGIASPATL